MIRQHYPVVDVVVNNAGGSVPAGTDLRELADACSGRSLPEERDHRGAAHVRRCCLSCGGRAGG